MEKGSNRWRKWESLTSSEFRGSSSLGGARTPPFVGGKSGCRKFVGRIVGSLASFTYSYFKNILFKL